MCVGKTNRRIPKSARAQADFAAKQARSHQDHILGLEVDELNQLGDESYQAARGQILSGRANADAAAGERGTLNTLRRGANLASGRGGLAQGDIISGSQELRTKGVLGGQVTGENMTMSDRFGALQTGQGHARGVSAGLGAAARNELVAQAAADQGEMQVGRALSGLAATAGVAGYVGYKRAMDPTVADENLTILGKGLRGVFGTPAQDMGQTGSYGKYQAPTSPLGASTDPHSNFFDAGPTSQFASTPEPSKFKGFTNWIRKI